MLSSTTVGVIWFSLSSLTTVRPVGPYPITTALCAGLVGRVALDAAAPACEGATRFSARQSRGLAAIHRSAGSMAR